MRIIGARRIPHECEHQRQRRPQHAGEVGLLRDGPHSPPRHRDQNHHVLQDELGDASVGDGTVDM